jgi:carboxymethylenebutenolidase
MNKTILLIAPDGGQIDARIAVPTSRMGPGVFVLGAPDPVAWCARFAAEGYVAVALDLSRHLIDGRLSSAARSAALADLYVAKSALAHHVTGGDWGAVGIGAGGAVVWRAALHGAVAAAAIYGLTAIGDERRASPTIRAPLTLHVDADDAHAAGAEFDAMRTEDTETRFRLYVYPRGRSGCFDPGHPAFEPHSATLAHSRTLAALRPVLGPHYDFGRLFEQHLAHEFVDRDADATMETMVDEPYVNHVPTLTGGVGYEMLKRFYRYHFIPKLPPDRESVVLSETVGADTVVLEMVNSFTHTEEVDYFLPGLAPTGKRVVIPTVVIAKFRGDKLYHEHIYWDQASVLVQLGLLAPDGLPVAGVEEARKMLDQQRPANELMPSWRSSEGLPIEEPVTAASSGYRSEHAG